MGRTFPSFRLTPDPSTKMSSRRRMASPCAFLSRLLKFFSQFARFPLLKWSLFPIYALPNPICVRRPQGNRVCFSAKLGPQVWSKSAKHRSLIDLAPLSSWNSNSGKNQTFSVLRSGVLSSLLSHFESTPKIVPNNSSFFREPSAETFSRPPQCSFFKTSLLSPTFLTAELVDPKSPPWTFSHGVPGSQKIWVSNLSKNPPPRKKPLVMAGRQFFFLGQTMSQILCFIVRLVDIPFPKASFLLHELRNPQSYGVGHPPQPISSSPYSE